MTADKEKKLTYRQQYYLDNKEALKADSKEYYLIHRDEALERKRKYNAEHAEERNAKQKNYSETHKEEIKEYRKEFEEKNFPGRREERIEIKKIKKEKTKNKQKSRFKEPRRRFGAAKKHAPKRNLTWNISFDEYQELIKLPCYYCNNTFGSTQNCGGVGLDRLDNYIGYEINNVVPCCYPCNIIRGGALSSNEMIVAMQAVLQLRALYNNTNIIQNNWLQGKKRDAILFHINESNELFYKDIKLAKIFNKKFEFIVFKNEDNIMSNILDQAKEFLILQNYIEG